MTGIQSHAFGQVRKIEQHRDQLATELRKALAEIERIAHELATMKAERKTKCSNG